jgi:hypothetical protein
MLVGKMVAASLDRVASFAGFLMVFPGPVAGFGFEQPVRHCHTISCLNIRAIPATIESKNRFSDLISSDSKSQEELTWPYPGIYGFVLLIWLRQVFRGAKLRGGLK